MARVAGFCAVFLRLSHSLMRGGTEKWNQHLLLENTSLEQWRKESIRSTQYGKTEKHQCTKSGSERMDIFGRVQTQVPGAIYIRTLKTATAYTGIL